MLSDTPLLTLAAYRSPRPWNELMDIRELKKIADLSYEPKPPVCGDCGKVREFLGFYGGQPIYVPCDCYERETGEFDSVCRVKPRISSASSSRLLTSV